ncbi:MAG: CcmD family protein [Hydrotalea sp.]|jgi:uncharacterized transporter YbjL|nr:CcmD family protein [Hydrotalea sp.]
MKKFNFLLLAMFALIGFVEAQPNNESVMMSNGKIYVVMAVVVTIVFGLFLYLFLLDRKISKLEK